MASMAFQIPPAGIKTVAENIFNGAGAAFKKEVTEEIDLDNETSVKHDHDVIPAPFWFTRASLKLIVYQ